jgi:hypothetical protein
MEIIPVKDNIVSNPGVEGFVGCKPESVCAVIA